MTRRWSATAALLLALPFAAAAGPGPVIDMHVHAYPLDVPPGAPGLPRRSAGTGAHLASVIR